MRRQNVRSVAPIGAIPRHLFSKVDEEAEEKAPKWWFVEARDYTGFDSCIWWYYIRLLHYRRSRPAFASLSVETLEQLIDPVDPKLIAQLDVQGLHKSAPSFAKPLVALALENAKFPVR